MLEVGAPKDEMGAINAPTTATTNNFDEHVALRRPQVKQQKQKQNTAPIKATLKSHEIGGYHYTLYCRRLAQCSICLIGQRRQPATYRRFAGRQTQMKIQAR